MVSESGSHSNCGSNLYSMLEFDSAPHGSQLSHFAEFIYTQINGIYISYYPCFN